MNKNKITLILVILIFIVLSFQIYISIYYPSPFNLQRQRWSADNHCDALCVGEYGVSHINQYHNTQNKSTVIPLDDNYDAYICICDKGNITTKWTTL